MPRPQDDNFEADSSDVSQIDDGNVTDLSAADSSAAAQGDNAPTDLLSIVRDVVAPKDEAGKDAAASPADSAETESSAEGAKDGDAEDDFSDVPFNQHPRWKQILTQRNEARENAKVLKRDADLYQNVQTFIDDHGLSAEEAADGLVIFAMAKTDPVGAWEAAKPWFQKLVIAAGVVLPPDIKQMVDAGQMSQEAAAEVSRARAQVASVQTKQQFEAQRAAQRQTTDAQSAVARTVNEWQKNRQDKDPNFGAKLQPIMEKVAYLHATEGKPTTNEGIKAQLDKAYKAVNASLPAAIVKPAPVQRQQIRPGSANGSVAAGAPKPKSGSLLDIVRANRAQA
jgi:hypothetical protein